MIRLSLLALLLASTIVESKSERDCLAEALYFEARSEGLKGKRLVGYVIHNRRLSKHWPNTYCGVIYQKHQFEYVKRVKRKRMKGKAKTIAYKIADEILALPQIATYGNTRWFHATWMKKWPKWKHNGKPLKLLEIHKRHAFYIEG